MITISGAFTQRACTWDEWKDFQSSKAFVWQSKTECDVYWIWGYDGPEVFTTQIWRGAVPPMILSESFTQDQNDANKTDWETNYLPTTNGKIG